jgi:hypothetical protein
MKKSVTLMSLPLTLLIILFASFQSRSMSPGMYSFLPASAFDWSY